MNCPLSRGIILCLMLAAAGLSRAAGSGGASIVELDDAMCSELKAKHVMQPQPAVGCGRLRLVRIEYLGFDNQPHRDGRIMVLDVVAPHVLDIFDELRKENIRINKVELMNNYMGDDDASTRDNNSSSFNDREISGGGRPSLHAYGLAIDINPIQNPYIKRGDDSSISVSPRNGDQFLNRSEDRPGKAKRVGMAESMIEIFANHGFLGWGGYWDNPIDYQHFQVSRRMADLLIAASPADGAGRFREYIQQYRDCRKSGSRLQCIELAEPAP
jgi:hypothetical protein